MVRYSVKSMNVETINVSWSRGLLQKRDKNSFYAGQGTFETLDFSFDTLANRLRELAF